MAYRGENDHNFQLHDFIRRRQADGNYEVVSLCEQKRENVPIDRSIRFLDGRESLLDWFKDLGSYLETVF